MTNKQARPQVKREKTVRAAQAAEELKDAENEVTHIPPVATAVMKLYGSGGAIKWESVDDVCALLEELQLGEYEDTFRKHDVDMQLFLALSKTDLVDALGVNKLAARRVIMDLKAYLVQLQNKNVQSLPEDGRLLTLFDNMRQTLTWFRLSVILLQYAIYTISLVPLYSRRSLAVALGTIAVVYSALVSLYTTYRYTKIVRMVENMHEDYRPDKLSLLIPSMLMLIIAMLVLVWVAHGSADDAERMPDSDTREYADGRASGRNFIEPLVFLVLSVA
ncbi:hypothetical protein FVE85_0660 [Porphyridium purpureum]|uniref:SAM domain-containing protein n=1 Tax=Porphyridium purpureum TaxID=35688 RepID=A0A5J4YZ72_PORPP|nr:hypothetical protein FVE85_0660 [Porphyridium purpureum]|eukprot:POR6317..scf208_2